MSEGTEPVKALCDRFKTFKFWSPPIEGGMVPCKLLLSSRILSMSGSDAKTFGTFP